MLELKKILEIIEIKDKMIKEGKGGTKELTAFINENIPFAGKDNFNMGVDYIVNLIETGEFNISPKYQRDYVWTYPQQINLIKSILLQIPIPSLIVNYLGDYSGNYNLIDGKQRVTTLVKYINNEFNVDGYYFTDLSPLIQGKIKNYTFSIIGLEIKEDLEQDYYTIYNYSGTKHD